MSRGDSLLVSKHRSSRFVFLSFVLAPPGGVAKQHFSHSVSEDLKFAKTSMSNFAKGLDQVMTVMGVKAESTTDRRMLRL